MTDTAARGAGALAPRRPVVAVTGDGGFGRYAMELTTAVKYGMPHKHVLLDNHGLRKISKEQVAGDFPVRLTSLVNPDWADFARLCGATGLTARAPDDLDAAVAALFATPPDRPRSTWSRTATSSDPHTHHDRRRSTSWRTRRTTSPGCAPCSSTAR